MKEILGELIRSYRDQCDYLEIRIEESESISIRFSGKLLEQAGKRMEKGGFIRALYHGGWGQVSFNSLNNLEEYIKAAVKQARLVGNSESKLAPVPVVEDVVRLKLNSDPRKVSFEEKLELIKNYNDIALNYDKRIKSTNSSYNETFSTIFFANSEGSYIYQEKMDLSGAVTAIAVEETNRQSAGAAFGSTNDFNAALGLEDKIREKCQIAVDLLSAPKVKAGVYTVITDPHLTGVFVHEAFGHLSEGDNVYEDENLQQIMKIGAEMGSPILNICDSGTVEGTRGYLIYDDEGMKTEKTYLIKEGKLVGRLHSRETAGKMGEKATGNARALSYKFPPICRMRCTTIEPGTSALEEMMEGIDLGILAISSRGGETNGEMFTFSASYAYMIRNGKKAELVRDVSLTGSVFTTLKNIDMIGKELKIEDGQGGCGKGEQFPLPVSNGGPYIRIQKVVVGGDE